MVIDDHKLHCEVNPAKHRNFNAKFIKHVTDNRVGMVIDTLSLTTTLLVASLHVAIKGRKHHANLQHQLFGVAFGRDPFNPPDLHGTEIHGDRGYFSENAFMAILLLTGCYLACTCPRGHWLPFVIGNEIVKEHDRRMRILEEGLMTCEVREKVFTAENGRKMTLAITAFRNGNGKVILVASSIHRRLTMDFVTTTERFGELWKNNRQKLIELSFGLEFSRFKGFQREEEHRAYLQVYLALPVTIVTAFQGH